MKNRTFGFIANSDCHTLKIVLIMKNMTFDFTEFANSYCNTLKIVHSFVVLYLLYVLLVLYIVSVHITDWFNSNFRIFEHMLVRLHRILGKLTFLNSEEFVQRVVQFFCYSRDT